MQSKASGGVGGSAKRNAMYVWVVETKLT